MNYSVKVATKIAAVMGKIEYLKKDGKMEFGTTKYNFLSEAKITKELREKTLEVGLVIVPIGCDVIELLNQSEAVEMEYAIIDIESGEGIEVKIAGKGKDVGDKSMYKAMTGAYKYMQRQTFAIPTGEDPDKISSEETELEIKKDKAKKQQDAKEEAEAMKGVMTVEQAAALKITFGEYVAKPLGEIYKTDIECIKQLIKECSDETVLKAIGVLKVAVQSVHKI